MDEREFQHAWETEYIVARVRDVTIAVNDGNYERAIDILQMIQSMAKDTENLLKK